MSEYIALRDEQGFAWAITNDSGDVLVHLQPGTARNESEGGVAKLLDLLNEGRQEPSPAASRYPWPDAPEWAMWAATDENGDQWWFASPPVARKMLWDADLRFDHARAVQFDSRGHYPEWRDTLERRPTDPRTEQRG